MPGFDIVELSVNHLMFIVGAGAVLILILFVRRGRPQLHDSVLTQYLAESRKQIDELRNQLSEQRVELSKQISGVFLQNSEFLQTTQKSYSQTMGQLHHRLGEVQESMVSIREISKDISSLQDILKAPKLRGGMGEFMLSELLRDVLPEEHYSLQYSFAGGGKVDAVIRLSEGLVPVDAKFPLENFKRILVGETEESKAAARKIFYSDVKKHIDSIAQKYILPDEGTFDFAMMYIPAENVYYEIILKDENDSLNLSHYAMAKKIIPVSPNSFYAYLHAIARGLKGLRIEKSARVILENLGRLETDFSRCVEEFEKLGTHLQHAASSYDKTSKRMDQLRTKLDRIELAGEAASSAD